MEEKYRIRKLETDQLNLHRGLHDMHVNLTIRGSKGVKNPLCPDGNRVCALSSILELKRAESDLLNITSTTLGRFCCHRISLVDYPWEIRGTNNVDDAFRRRMTPRDWEGRQRYIDRNSGVVRLVITITTNPPAESQTGDLVVSFQSITSFQYYAES